MFRWASFTYDPRGRGGARGGFWGFDLLKRRWGFDRSTVYVNDQRYLDRWILYVNGWTLRLHRFWRGDDDRASHTHPWFFITFPLNDYLECVYKQGRFVGPRWVKRFRFHYRPADFEHYVKYGVAKSWWTIVLTGPKRDTWGFYPFDKVWGARSQSGATRFVKWTEWE